MEHCDKTKWWLSCVCLSHTGLSSRLSSSACASTFLNVCKFVYCTMYTIYVRTYICALTMHQCSITVCVLYYPILLHYSILLYCTILQYTTILHYSTILHYTTILYHTTVKYYSIYWTIFRQLLHIFSSVLPRVVQMQERRQNITMAPHQCWRALLQRVL